MSPSGESARGKSQTERCAQTSNLPLICYATKYRVVAWLYKLCFGGLMFPTQIIKIKDGYVGVYTGKMGEDC